MTDRAKSRELENQASLLLKDTPALARQICGPSLIGISKREFEKNHTQRATIRLLDAYRSLPKATRRALTAEYKALPDKPDWNLWLLTKADVVMGRALPA